MSMKPPSIPDAKRIALELRARGVIVLAYDGERFGGSSYGLTRKDCDFLRAVFDKIYESVMEPVEEQGMGTESRAD